MKSNNRILGTLLVLLGGTCWGIGGVAGERLLKENDVSTLDIIPLRLLFSGILILIYCLFTEKKRTFKVWQTKRDAIDVLIYAFFGLALCQLTYYLTIEYSNAGTATVLQYMAPVIILAITCFCDKRVPFANEVICMILALSGVFFLATHGSLNSLALSPKALIIGIISAFTVVVYNMQPARLLKKHSPAVLLGWAMTIAGIITNIVFKTWVDFPEITLTKVILFLIIVVFGTVLAFVSYMKGVTLIGPAKASLYSGIEPVCAVVLSTLLLGTHFAVMDIVGFICILSAIFILALTKNHKHGSVDKKSVL